MEQVTGKLTFSSVQFSSVAQSCPTLCDPMNCSTPGLPVHPTPMVDTEPLFELPERVIQQILAGYITYGNVRFHVTLSMYLTLSSLLPMSVSLFFMSVSPLLPCK